VSDRARSRVSIGREVDASLMGREGEKGADQTGVLVRVAVVLLSPEGGGLDVVKRGVGSEKVQVWGGEGRRVNLGISSSESWLETERGMRGEEEGGRTIASWSPLRS
jgi:hypothetical protein